MSEKNIQDETCFTFPCEFPIKAMGKTGEDLEIAVMEIVNRHVDDIKEGAVSFNSSKGGKYTSITIAITAQSKAQLDAIYMDLTAHELVLYAL